MPTTTNEDEEPSYPGRRRRPTDDAVDVTRLRVPLLLTIGLLVGAVSALASVAAVWFQVTAHINNHVVHLDERVAVEGGGPAMRNDMGQLRNDFKWDLLKAVQQLRHDINNMAATCTPTGSGRRLTCTFHLPETE